MTNGHETVTYGTLAGELEVASDGVILRLQRAEGPLKCNGRFRAGEEGAIWSPRRPRFLAPKAFGARNDTLTVSINQLGYSRPSAQGRQSGSDLFFRRQEAAMIQRFEL